MATCLKKKTDKYTSGDIQNEVLSVMANSILRTIVEEVKAAKFCSIMVDETPDIANKEQVIICLCWVDSTLTAHEDFVGLYKVQSTQAIALFKVIQDILLRFGISVNCLRGQCYDGASSMSGYRSGVATMMQKEEPRAIFTHCYGHSLNLACMDTIKRCSLLRNCLDVVQEMTNLIKKSPRRDALLQTLKEEINVQSPGIRVLCPTRWTVRADCLDSILRNYNVLFQLWEESLDIVKEAEMRGRIIGVSTYMKSFDVYFGVILSEMLLRHSDNLSKSLQTSQMSAAEGQQVASLTVRTLTSLREDGQFELFWTKVTTLADAAGVHEPVLPRCCKAPKRFEVGN